MRTGNNIIFTKMLQKSIIGIRQILMLFLLIVIGLIYDVLIAGENIEIEEKNQRSTVLKKPEEIQRRLTEIKVQWNEALSLKKEEIKMIEEDAKRVSQREEMIKKAEEELGTAKSELSSLINMSNSLMHQVNTSKEEGPEVVINIGSEIYNTDKNPVFFEISKGKIAPVQEPFYKSEEILLTLYRITRYTKVKEGEDAQELKKPESKVMKILNEIDAETQYPVLVVQPDSFQEFYKIHKIVKAKFKDVGWRPHNLQHILLGSGIGEKPNPQK